MGSVVHVESRGVDVREGGMAYLLLLALLVLSKEVKRRKGVRQGLRLRECRSTADAHFLSCYGSLWIHPSIEYMSVYLSVECLPVAGAAPSAPRMPGRCLSTRPAGGARPPEARGGRGREVRVW